MEGIQTEATAEKIIKEKQTIAKRESRFPKTPLADMAPSPAPQIAEKRTIDLTLDDDEDEILVPSGRKRMN